MCSGVQELTDADLERLTVALAKGLTVNPWYIAVSGNRCLTSSRRAPLRVHALFTRLKLSLATLDSLVIVFG